MSHEKKRATTSTARRRRRSSRRKLQKARIPAIVRYVKSMVRETYIVHSAVGLFILWLAFATAIYLAEQRAADPVFGSLGEALYWGIAAFSTAGIANTPSPGLPQLIGGVWIITGSAIFFGIIIAAITGYFMRPLHRPAHKIVEAIEYNLEKLDELSVEELDLLKETTDSLISHMEALKKRAASKRRPTA